MLSSKIIKLDFPIFTHHPDLVYLDSAATTLKPQAVIDAEKEYLEQYSSNVGRGLYPLAETATEKFEAVRKQVSAFIGAKGPQEIVFTAGTTASINLVAQLIEKSLFSAIPADEPESRSRIKSGMTKANIVTTELEHHSNFLPWKELARAKDATFRVVPITEDGLIDLEALRNSIDDHTRVVAFSAVSNVLGTISPVSEIVAMIKSINPKTIILIDAAQAIGHAPMDVSKWNADFVAFSAHKMFGTTGVGILYGKKTLLETLRPVIFGGGMVLDACAKKTLYRESPYCFEAGTQNIGGVIALGAAIKYIENIGRENIRVHETALTAYTLKRLRETFGKHIRIIGPGEASERGGIVAFSLKDIHPHDIAQLLGERNICVRAGEHCAAPLHRKFHLNATTRVSLSIYNDEKDIDKLVARLEEISEIMSNT
ncbi:MAG: SufS family cysteine desulfurase [Candidatus Moranbacteria bacterium]|nr:SufS family cysteine desulfurase [Candidatus Moranbacteria bacterium]